jgi:N-methylhydantoinase A
MRLIGQAHEITVQLPGPAPRAGDEDRIAAAFAETYASLYGRTPPGVPVEVVSWRVRVAGPNPGLRLSAQRARANGEARSGERRAFFPELGGFQLTPTYDRYRLTPGSEFRGPAIVEERESTLIIGPGARARVDDYLNVIVEIGPAERAAEPG